MKIECSIEKLSEAASHAERITGKNLTLPLLSSVLLTASGKVLTLRSTNLNLGFEMSIPAKISTEGIVAVPGGVFNSLLTALPSKGTVLIESKDNTLLVESGLTATTLKTNSPDDFPTIPKVSGFSFTLSSKKFIEGMRSVYYSASLSEIKPEISCVYMYPGDGTLVFVATDSFRLAEKKIKAKHDGDFPGALIPFKNSMELVRIISTVDADLTLTATKNQLSVSGGGLYLTSRLVDGIFPDYKQIVPKGFTTEAVLLKQDLMDALKLSTIFSDKFNQATLFISPKQKKCEIRSKNTDVGEQTTSIDAALSGEDVEINFNYKYLFDCFQSIAEDSISLRVSDTNKPIVVEGVSNPTFLYLVMPMNR